MADRFPPLQGRVVMITGATAGIGRAAATDLARLQATLVLVGRDPQRTQATVDAIRRETGSATVTSLLADLCSMQAVRDLAAAFRREHERLHVLINNAGGVFWTRARTVDGLEMTFALNHLSPFLLTNLLLDTLKVSAPARIITVSSDAHTGGRARFGDPQHQGRYRGYRAYSESKLDNLLFTYELARRLEGTGVTANALHPGFVATNFGHSGMMRWLMPIAQRFAISPEEGARTIVYLAASPDVAQVSGKYFYKERPIASSPASANLDHQRRLWQISEELTGLRPAA